MRTRGEPHAFSVAIQKELREASGGLPVARIKSMDEIVVKSTARSDFNMLLLTVFGAAALLLAAIGVYGLMSYSVEQRTQEIGIRLALGAAVGQVRNMVIVQGMTLALAGVAIGLIAAVALVEADREPAVRRHRAGPDGLRGGAGDSRRGRADRGLAPGLARDAHRSD